MTLKRLSVTRESVYLLLENRYLRKFVVSILYSRQYVMCGRSGACQGVVGAAGGQPTGARDVDECQQSPAGADGGRGSVLCTPHAH